MKKITTRQYIDMFGITEGKAFVVNGKQPLHYRVHGTIIHEYDAKGAPTGKTYHLSWILDEEVWNLPPHVLTEQEKVIVRLDFQEGSEKIANTPEGVYVTNRGGDWLIQLDSRMFAFIEEGESVDIETMKEWI